ncbi:MAG: LuxR C-terminal-related transcriptional regulator [Microcella sp.]
MMFVEDPRDGAGPSPEAVVDHRDRLLASLEESGFDELPALLERRLVEWWFLLDPVELNALLDRVEPNTLARSPLASAIFVLTGGSASDVDKDALLRARVAGLQEVSVQRALRTPAPQRLATALLWRLRGRTRDALTLARATVPSGPAPLLADPTAGWSSFVALQTAITAALAGELRVARDSLEFVMMARHPRHLSFQLRDAYSLAALLDASFGEPESARDHLAHASTVARTTSWTEPLIDARIQSVERVLAAREHYRTVTLSAPDAHGELWPYTALAVGDTAILAGQFRELDAHAARLSRVMHRDPAADGLPATAIPWLRAAVAIEEVRLDDAKALLDLCDDAVPLTALARAVLALRRHDPESALGFADRLSVAAADYARLRTAAHYLRAEALVMLGRDVDAVRTLESIPPVSEWVLDHTVVAVSATLVDAVHKPEFRASRAPAIAAMTRARQHGVQMPQAPMLTPRQREILQLLRAGRSRAEIATALHLSPNTVKTHLRMLFDRLEVASRDHAIEKAIAWGLVS